MPFYLQNGNIPQKRHVAFYKSDKTLFREELFSTHGFSNVYCNKYHHNMPTKVLNNKPMKSRYQEPWNPQLIDNYKLNTNEIDKPGTFHSNRNKIFYNQDVALNTIHFTKNSSEFFKNAYCDEVLFFQHGSATFNCDLGQISIEPWDYLVIPKGTIYQITIPENHKTKVFSIESPSMIQIPKQFRNEYGQLNEDAPYCERDIKTPKLQTPIVEKGIFPVIIKSGEHHQQLDLEWHPFDVEGWDGCAYPWAINIKDYCPTVGRVHLPPPVHLIFAANNFVVCNFVPRPFDFHEKAIPCPYYHSNVDSDEVLYYVDGDFMSRTGIQPGYMTLHQKGLPHGPQPGKTEDSLGKTDVYEYAVMVDTFNPLQLTTHVKNTMDPNYTSSWIEN